jgi:hypothetical protein
MNAALLRSTDTRKGHTVNLVLTVRRRSSFLIVSLNPADVRVGWHVDALRLHSLYPACAREQGYIGVPLNAVNGPVLVHYLVVLTGLQIS